MKPPRRRGHLWALMAVIAAVTSSCRMEMGIGTTLRADGSGVFTMAVAFDKEFIDGLREVGAGAGRSGSSGVGEFEAFFSALRDKGWSYRRTETPAGDLALRAACAFPDSPGFDRCLSQLSSLDAGSGAGELRNFGLAFDFGITRSFFRTRSWFAGTANLSGPDDDRLRKAVAQLRTIAGDTFRFEIRADLPGSVAIVSGQGHVEDGIAIWRPRVGERLDLRAEARAYNVAAVVTVVGPLVAAAALAAWILARRRGRRGDDLGEFPPGPPELEVAGSTREGDRP